MVGQTGVQQAPQRREPALILRVRPRGRHICTCAQSKGLQVARSLASHQTVGKRDGNGC